MESPLASAWALPTWILKGFVVSMDVILFLKRAYDVEWGEMKLLKPRNLNISSYTTSNTGTSNEDVYESENVKISSKWIRSKMAFKILLNATKSVYVVLLVRNTHFRAILTDKHHLKMKNEKKGWKNPVIVTIDILSSNLYVRHLPSLHFKSYLTGTCSHNNQSTVFVIGMEEVTFKGGKAGSYAYITSFPPDNAFLSHKLQPSATRLGRQSEN